VEHGQFESPNPEVFYDWIIQPRKALMNPDVCFVISKTILQTLAGFDPDLNFQICSPERSPLGPALSLTARYLDLGVNVFLCKDQIEPYTLLNQFEGSVDNKLTVIVDEMSNHGKSMKHCFDSLNNAGIPVASVAMSVISKRNGKNQQDIYLPKGITVLSLFNLDDLNLQLGKKK
jgi:orotate phosphoribosyltransferase